MTLNPLESQLVLDVPLALVVILGFAAFLVDKLFLILEAIERRARRKQGIEFGPDDDPGATILPFPRQLTRSQLQELERELFDRAAAMEAGER